MNALGLDLSLTSTGFCGRAGVGVLRPGKRRGEERLVWIRDHVIGLLLEGEPRLVVIEGYAFGAGGHAIAGARAIGELGGVVRVALYELGVPFAIVPPATLKKYATGKGNAPKEAVLVAGVKRSLFEFESTDEADAWWLYAMAMDQYGAALVDLPKVNRQALEGVEWPDLEVAV